MSPNDSIRFRQFWFVVNNAVDLMSDCLMCNEKLIKYYPPFLRYKLKYIVHDADFLNISKTPSPLKTFKSNLSEFYDYTIIIE
jgi:hypothetical protein